MALLWRRAFAESRDTAYKGVSGQWKAPSSPSPKDTATAAELALRETTDPFENFGSHRPRRQCVGGTHPGTAPRSQTGRGGRLGWQGDCFLFLKGCCVILTANHWMHRLPTVQPLSAMNLENAMEDIEPGQDFEVVVDFVPAGELDLRTFYADLEQMGTSIQVGEGEGMYRMHIHVPTENRHKPVDYIMGIGTVTKIAMENLLAQMDDVNKNSAKGRIELAAIEPGQLLLSRSSPAGASRAFLPAWAWRPSWKAGKP